MGSQVSSSLSFTTSARKLFYSCSNSSQASAMRMRGYFQFATLQLNFAVTSVIANIFLVVLKTQLQQWMSKIGQILNVFEQKNNAMLYINISKGSIQISNQYHYRFLAKKGNNLKIILWRRWWHKFETLYEVSLSSSVDLAWVNILAEFCSENVSLSADS